MSRKIILIKQELLLLVYELNRSGLLAENEKIRPILAQLEKLLLCDLSGLIRVRNIRALNGRFNTSITHAYSIVIGSKHITLNATGGGFLTASKQFRHGATSKSRSNTASNSTKHKSPHLSGWRQ